MAHIAHFRTKRRIIAINAIFYMMTVKNICGVLLLTHIKTKYRTF